MRSQVPLLWRKSIQSRDNPNRSNLTRDYASLVFLMELIQWDKMKSNENENKWRNCFARTISKFRANIFAHLCIFWLCSFFTILKEQCFCLFCSLPANGNQLFIKADKRNEMLENNAILSALCLSLPVYIVCVCLFTRIVSLHLGVGVEVWWEQNICIPQYQFKWQWESIRTYVDIRLSLHNYVCINIHR